MSSGAAAGSPDGCCGGQKEHTNRQYRVEGAPAGDEAPVYACLINRDWLDQGKATILLARGLNGCRLNVAAFLVDLWAMGLKDAWGRLELGVGEFEQSVRRMHGLRMNSIDLDTARHIVYGGIRLACELGFRLPQRHERWTSILGPLARGVEPDRSLFLKNGRICLVGHMRELHERLTGCSADAFLGRPDVEFILSVDESDDPAELAIDLEFQDARGGDSPFMEGALSDEILRWCFAHRRVPHRLLPQAVDCLVDALLHSAGDSDDDWGYAANREPLASLHMHSDRLVRAALPLLRAAHPHEDPIELRRALCQAGEFVLSLGSPEAVMATLGLLAAEQVEC